MQAGSGGVVHKDLNLIIAILLKPPPKSLYVVACEIANFQTRHKANMPLAKH